MMYPFSVSYILGRVALFFVISFVWYFALWWIAVPLTLFYVWQYRGYELLVLGVLIDVQFLTGMFIPYYTVGAMLLLLAANITKPLLRPRKLQYEIE